MRTKLVFLTIALVSSFSLAHPLTNGKYVGHGQWRSESANGQYNHEAVVGEKKIQTKYLLADGSAKEWNFEIVETTNTFFSVLNQGVRIGSGYCLDQAPVCHYEISVGSFRLEETIVQQAANMYRFGSKIQDQDTITWQEKMILQPNGKE